MAEDWVEQMKNQVNTLENLAKYINVSEDEREAIETLKTKWGTSPYFASLMNKDAPNCPIRKQVIPSLKEQINEYGMENYLVWKENRATEEIRPDSIAHQYHDRVAFTVVQVCDQYSEDSIMQSVIKETEEEMKLFEEHEKHYGYSFYIMKAV